jgi:hypothetical protein
MFKPLGQRLWQQNNASELNQKSSPLASRRGSASAMPDTFLCMSAAQVMNNKQNKQMLTFVGGFAVVLLLLYYLFF